MKGAVQKRRFHIKAGDIVAAISGEDAAAGKTGKVLRVFPREERAIVEGLNLVKKTLRKSQDHPQGGILEKEAPIHISNLRLADEPAKPVAKKTAKEKKSDGK